MQLENKRLYSLTKNKKTYYMAKIVAGILSKFFQLFAKKSNYKVEEISEDERFIHRLLAPIRKEFDVSRSAFELFCKDIYKHNEALGISGNSKEFELAGTWHIWDKLGGRFIINKIFVKKKEPQVSEQIQSHYQLKVSFFDSQRDLDRGQESEIKVDSILLGEV